MTGSWIDDQAWNVTGIPCNTDSAIFKLWRQLRSEGKPIGLPVTGEIETPVGVQQAFTSGVVLGWNAEDGAYIASDA
jgi:hypothetical protein